MASSGGPGAIRLGSDTTFVIDVPTEPQHTLKIAEFDEASSKDFQFERISAALARAVAVLPQIQWRVQSVPLRLNRPVWITDPAFDVRNHLRHARLAEPGTKRQLCQMIGEVASEAIPPAQPPWELWFLEGYEGSKVVAVLKMNHAMADGGTFALLLELLTSTEPGAAPVALAIPRPASALSRADALRDGARELWQEYRHELPKRLRAIRQARAKARKSPPLPRLPSVIGGPKVPWCGPLTPRRSFSWVSVPLDEVKQIEKVISGTANDVVFAIVARAVRANLAGQGMLTDRPVLAETAAKNRRLRAAQAQNAAVKAHVTARAVQLEDWFDFVPPFLFGPMLKLTRFAAQRTTGGVIVSNVNGPREKRYVGGMGIENFISCGHLKFAAGVNITVWSYSKMLNFAVYGCSRTLPDAEVLTQQVQSSFDELRAAAGVSRSPGNGSTGPAPAELNATAAEGKQHV